jgi:hypothetical protein
VTRHLMVKPSHRANGGGVQSWHRLSVASAGRVRLDCPIGPKKRGATWRMPQT